MLIKRSPILIPAVQACVGGLQPQTCPKLGGPGRAGCQAHCVAWAQVAARARRRQVSRHHPLLQRDGPAPKAQTCGSACTYSSGTTPLAALRPSGPRRPPGGERVPGARGRPTFGYVLWLNAPLGCQRATTGGGTALAPKHWMLWGHSLLCRQRPSAGRPPHACGLLGDTIGAEKPCASCHEHTDVVCRVVCKRLVKKPRGSGQRDRRRRLGAPPSGRSQPPWQAAVVRPAESVRSGDSTADWRRRARGDDAAREARPAGQ
jgi:hypothetical protein